MDERRVVVVGYDAAELLDIACVTSSLDHREPHRRQSALRRQRAPARAVAPSPATPGLRLQAQEALERAPRPAGHAGRLRRLGHTRAAENHRLVGHVRRLAAREPPGRVGLHRGDASSPRRACSTAGAPRRHWRYADEFAARYPASPSIPDPIYVRDGNVATSPGVTSALDLTLAFIEEDHGAELAREVARGLVTYLQRPATRRR